MKLNTVEELIADIRAGRMVILMDDEDRENEGDLVMAATHVRPEDINFMITHARGLVCLTLTRERCQQLNLPLMVQRSGAAHGTNFTLSIEAAEGVSTGISAADRARTVQAAVAPMAKPADIVQPGHIFPLMAQPGGVLHRAGHTEAGCDLARLAGLEPAAVIVEVMNEDGTMARRPDLEVFAEKHNLKIGTIADLIHYRILNEKTVELVDQQPLHTTHGEFTLYRFSERGTPDTHIALVKGNPSEGVTTVRVHGFNPMRDLFGAGYQGKPVWISTRYSTPWQTVSAACWCGLVSKSRSIWVQPSMHLIAVNPHPHSVRSNIVVLGLALRFCVNWACAKCACSAHRSSLMHCLALIWKWSNTFRPKPKLFV
jgi:3,4-dihydroxy 2-butanone 4-phosphate synthase/GTP cyclohydrolase II